MGDAAFLYNKLLHSGRPVNFYIPPLIREMPVNLSGKKGMIWNGPCELYGIKSVTYASLLSLGIKERLNTQK